MSIFYAREIQKGISKAWTNGGPNLTLNQWTAPQMRIDSKEKMSYSTLVSATVK